MDCYALNTAAQFTTKLPHPISLQGEWEVALTEISVPVMFNNVKKDSCLLVLMKDMMCVHTYRIDAGYYSSIEKLIKFMNSMLRVNGISFLMYGKKVKMLNTGEFEVGFNVGLAKMSGFTKDLSYGPGKHIAQYSTDMSSEIVPTLFVYCDALEHVVVGDVMAPLLRIVDMKRKQTYGRMHQVLNPPLYVPLQKKHFDTIEINIMTDAGDAVPFAPGKSVAVLEFKRVGLLDKVIQRMVCCNFRHLQS